MAVEPHPEFAKIGQQLTSGMEGVTWRGLAGARPVAAGGEGAKGAPGAPGRGRPKGDYGELQLGDFSPEEARKAAEQAELDAARRRDAENPYARQPRLAPVAANPADHAGPSTGALMPKEDVPHRAGSGAAGGGGEPLIGDSEPDGGWDLILCSFAFAEKDAAGGDDAARHLKEVWLTIRRARVHACFP